MSGEIDTVASLIEEMRLISNDFSAKHGVNDIWSNSKVYEVIIANALQQRMIPGHSGSLDAMDANGNQFEYKHYKEQSSNHSWTFNDYSDSTIEKLRREVHGVIFAHIDDRVWPPEFDWAVVAKGREVAEYLNEKTPAIRNARRMINVSLLQLKKSGTGRFTKIPQDRAGGYSDLLGRIFDVVERLESISGVRNLLTSNKFWELMVSIPLDHTVNSEQGGRAGAHDASDRAGGVYEYKVSGAATWNFQDISDDVLDKYLFCEAIVLAIVDKPGLRVTKIYKGAPSSLVPVLRAKRDAKALRYAEKAKEVRRKQVTISKAEILRLGFEEVNI